MKKLAFILAIALVFTVGTTTVLKHNFSAKASSSNIVLWIPIDAKGDVVFDRVNSDCTKPGGPPSAVYPNPKDYEKIDFISTITVTKIKKNPYCYWIQQGGILVERCF